jgi:hypothetical protein
VVVLSERRHAPVTPLSQDIISASASSVDTPKQSGDHVCQPSLSSTFTAFRPFLAERPLARPKVAGGARWGYPSANRLAEALHEPSQSWLVVTLPDLT